MPASAPVRPQPLASGLATRPRSGLAKGWRPLLAAACLIAAAAHVPVTGEHLREATYIGVLFILLEVACVLLAGLLLRSPGRPVAVAVSVLGGAAVLALVVSRTVGLPLIGDDVGEWVEPLALLSLAAETVMLVGGALAATAAGRVLVGRRAGGVAGALILVAGAVVIGLAVAPAAGGASVPEHGGSGHEMPGMDMSGMDMSGSVAHQG